MVHICSLKELRESKGINQIDLANALGVTQTMVSLIENKQRGLSYTLLNKLCDVLSVTREELNCSAELTVRMRIDENLSKLKDNQLSIIDKLIQEIIRG